MMWRNCSFVAMILYGSFLTTTTMAFSLTHSHCHSWSRRRRWVIFQHSSLDSNEDYNYYYDFHPYDDDDEKNHAAQFTGDGGWSITDDWSAKSEAENQPVQGHDIFQQDILARAAARLERKKDDDTVGTERVVDDDDDDAWIQTAMEQILNPPSLDDDDDDDDDNNTNNAFIQYDEEGTEVARLVRCQEVPQAMLIAQGRAVPELTWEEAHHVRQLLIPYNQQEELEHGNGRDSHNYVDHWQPTEFMQRAVTTIFAAHTKDNYKSTYDATTNRNIVHNNNPSNTTHWDANAVAAWMRQCLQEPCGKHDARVLAVLSQFGRNGVLDVNGLQKLYLHAIVVGDKSQITTRNTAATTLTPERLNQAYQRIMATRADAVQAVWRDFKRHGVQSPAETEHAQALQAIETASSTSTTSLQHEDTDDSSSTTNLFMDECEIFDDAIPDGWYKDDITGTWQRHGKSSHAKVILAADQKTPLYLQDGDYVYIDEESCIGCTQCALAAPASFQMLDNGRARTFLQRGRIPDVQAAVKTCPVNCMHYVDFARLVTLEQARDSVNGDDGRTDHRHFGRDRRNGQTWRPHTPLYVARMESSDANHKDSLYHYTRRQCYQSNQCPSRGCYDCPLHASNPEANPHLHQNRQRGHHVRAQTFQDNGTADSFRRTAEL